MPKSNTTPVVKYGVIIKDAACPHICRMPLKANWFYRLFTSEICAELKHTSLYRCAGCNKVYMWEEYDRTTPGAYAIIYPRWAIVSDREWIEAGGVL